MATLKLLNAELAEGTLVIEGPDFPALKLEPGDKHELNIDAGREITIRLDVPTPETEANNEEKSNG